MNTSAAALVSVLAALACTSCMAGSAVTLHAENDTLGSGDNHNRYYTSGVRVSEIGDPAAAWGPARGLAEMLPVVCVEETTQIGWVAAQEIYTPSDIGRHNPDPDDRPYAGWLYGGIVVARAARSETGPAGDHADIFEVDVGITGPASFAEESSNVVHEIVDADDAEGWDKQIHTEPGIILQYEHRRRLLAGETPVWGAWDLLGGGSVAVGNIVDRAGVSAMVRWGSDVARDFGPHTGRSTTVTVPGEGPAESPRWYLFAGAEGWCVAHNMFLDGNTFEDSRDVPKERWVGEVRAGLAAEWGRFRLAYQFVTRSREFEGQEESQDYGAATLTWHFEF